MLPIRPSILATRTALLTAVTATAFLPLRVVGAQDTPEFSTGALYSSSSGPRCGAGMGLMSSAAYRGASLKLLPAPLTSLKGTGIGSPVVAASVETPESRRWQLRAGGAVGRAEPDCASLSDRDRAWASLSRRFGNSGVMLTLGSRSLSTLDPSRAMQGVTLGGWRSMGRARVSLEVRQHSASSRDWLRSDRSLSAGNGTLANSDTGSRGVDTMPPTQVPDSTPTPVQWRGVDVRTRLQWAVGRLALDLTVGGSTGSVAGRTARAPLDTPLTSATSRRNNSAMRLWGRADARVTVNSFLEITGGLAALPSQPLAQEPPRRVATLGFGITSVPRFSRPVAKDAPARDAGNRARAPFETVRIDSSTVRVRVRIANASGVELSSELTGWKPVPMQRAGDGWWEVSMTTPPGVYRVNLRVDGGAWTAPPGVPTVRDEFGGQVGLMPIG